MSDNVIQFHASPTSVQLSGYPQADSGPLYVVEVLKSDGTWDMSEDFTRDNAEGWRRAARKAYDLGLPLLPVSSFPGRAA